MLKTKTLNKKNNEKNIFEDSSYLQNETEYTNIHLNTHASYTMKTYRYAFLITCDTSYSKIHYTEAVRLCIGGGEK